MTVRNRTIAVLLGGLAGLLALPSLGHASPQPDDTVPGRSNDITLSITDSRDRIAVGEDTAYTATVRNEGEEAAPELLVAQIAPAHLDLREADGGGVIEDNTAAWLVSLGPGEEQTRTVTATLVEDPGQDTVATTVCAGWQEADSPLVCADDENTVGAQNGSVPLRPFFTGAGIAAAAALLVGLVVAVLRRPRKPRGRHARHRAAARR